MRHPLALACAVHAAASIAIGWLFAAHAGDEPYMDEIFHVRQAHRYCDGDLWTWDPKITTPPGLYLVGAGTHPGAGMPAVISSAKVIDQLIPAAVTQRA